MLVLTAPNGKKVLLYAIAGGWRGFILHTATVSASFLHHLQAIVQYFLTCSNGEWLLTVTCKNGSQEQRPAEFTATAVECSPLDLTFDVTLDSECVTDELDGVTTIQDTGIECNCCCSFSTLLAETGGECCSGLSEPDFAIPLEPIPFADGVNSCHSRSVFFYNTPQELPLSVPDCECLQPGCSDSPSECERIFEWIIEQLPGTATNTCLVRASLVGVADCPATLVVYEADNVSRAECRGDYLTLTKVSDETYGDCNMPDTVELT